MADLGSNIGSGAAAGASLGSVVPGIGTLIGGALGGLGGLLGGLFGGGTTTSTVQKNLQPAGADERRYGSLVNQQLGGLQDLFGQQNYGQFTGQIGSANQNYLDILNRLSQTGGIPTQQQSQAATGFYRDIFAPQQEQLRQQYVQQGYQAQQQAAAMGRPINDPILQAKLLAAQQNAQAGLGAQIASGAAQYAMQLPGQQAQYAGLAANQVNSLANQAAQNRMTLLGLGNQLQQQQQNFRLGAAGGTTSQQTGGSAGGALGGLLGGFGLGAQGGTYFNKLFSGQPEVSPSAPRTNVFGGQLSNISVLPASNFSGYQA